ncbi:MAG TPA: GNAT family N-acetyltransferase [Rhodanobacteraceae bacterium]|nr:GNAT family N-acetyltransferase [Rhodanobacteraceae bacterium]
MPDIVVRPLTAATIAPAAQLLAGSMRDNPLHRRVFGGDEARLEPLLARAFARLLRRQMGNGLVLAAYDEDALVGVAAMVAPGHCQPRLQDKLGMLMVLARAGALWRLPRIQRWLGRWKRHDPDIDHWHLGPAAVDRTRQGQGIGTGLMAEICKELDRRQGIGYLETDKDANVRLYRRGGFEIVAEQWILGVRNWFMLRHPLPRHEPLPGIDATSDTHAPKTQ